MLSWNADKMSRRMTPGIQIQNHDYIVVHDDDGFRIEQEIAGERRRIGGTFAFEQNAREHAKQLAIAHRSGAWLEHPPGVFELLSA
jgi:hypothetical protein